MLSAVMRATSLVSWPAETLDATSYKVVLKELYANQARELFNYAAIDESPT